MKIPLIKPIKTIINAYAGKKNAVLLVRNFRPPETGVIITGKNLKWMY
jgi:hypothetical protein